MSGVAGLQINYNWGSEQLSEYVITSGFSESDINEILDREHIDRNTNGQMLLDDAYSLKEKADAEYKKMKCCAKVLYCLGCRKSDQQ